MSVRSVCVRHGACRHHTTTPLWVNHSIDRAGGANTDDGIAFSAARAKAERSANGKILSRKTHSIPESGNPYALRSENRFQDSPSSGSSSSMKPARRTGGYKLFKFAASRRARAWAVRGVVSPLSEAGSSSPGFAYSRRSSGTVGVKSLSVVLVGDRGDDLLPSGVRGEKGRNADGETGVLGGDRNVA
jgi:hypothetical protein